MRLPQTGLQNQIPRTYSDQKMDDNKNIIINTQLIILIHYMNTQIFNKKKKKMRDNRHSISTDASASSPGDKLLLVAVDYCVTLPQSSWSPIGEGGSPVGEGLTEIMVCLSDAEVFALKMPMCDDGCLCVG